MLCVYRHSIISELESWSGVLEWSGVKIGVKFGVDFGVDFGVKFRVEVGFFLFFLGQLRVQLSRNSRINFKHHTHTGFSRERGYSISC